MGRSRLSSPIRVEVPIVHIAIALLSPFILAGKAEQIELEITLIGAVI
ncbi:MAG: hypothetical protein AAFQ89_08955 [Cyanobacteria bacterium J06626_18]